jgi:hypothetical protein
MRCPRRGKDKLNKNREGKRNNSGGKEKLNQRRGKERADALANSACAHMCAHALAALSTGKGKRYALAHTHMRRAFLCCALSFGHYALPEAKQQVLAHINQPCLLRGQTWRRLRPLAGAERRRRRWSKTDYVHFSVAWKQALVGNTAPARPQFPSSQTFWVCALVFLGTRPWEGGRP